VIYLKGSLETIRNVNFCIFIVLEMLNSISYLCVEVKMKLSKCGAVYCKHLKLYNPIVAKR
jgi:hypothetical protein